MFGDEDMRHIFSDKGLVQRYLEVEVALARAEAKVGIVPHQAAAAIENASRRLLVDFERLQRETENVGYPILGIVHQLAEAAGDAGGFVHWGATTQDIMDTATVLQIRHALDLLEEKLMAIGKSMARLAARHRNTPMVGRTHMQQALPITFGYKVWPSGSR